MDFGQIKVGFLAIFFALMATSISTGKPLTDAETPVCKDVRHCLGILERHDVKSFDYRVLTSEFSRFGSKGTSALLSALSDKNTELSNRAALLLYLGEYEFTPDEQTQIADLWPRRDPRPLADLMVKYYSPIMRKAAILTLSNSDQAVSTYARGIIQRGESKVSDTPQFVPSSKFFLPLKKAIISEPSIELIQFISSYPFEETAEILDQSLKSERPEIIDISYRILEDHDGDRAFDKLSQTIQQLTPGEEKTGLALAQVLTNLIGSQPLRKETSEPNRYREYVKRLIEDTDTPPLARMVGVDTLMQLRWDMPLPKSPYTQQGLETALQSYGTVPLRYIESLDQKISDDRDIFLPLLWRSVNSQGSRNKSIFIENLANAAMTEPVTRMLLSALEDPSDWKTVSNAAEILAKHNVVAAKTKLRIIAENNPVLMAQVAALAALDALEGEEYDVRKTYWLKKLLASTKSCDVTPIDFKDEARQLPFFNDAKMAYGYETKRYSLTSAVPTKRGWVAGYSAGQYSGGLIAYDNKTGDGELIYGLSEKGEGYDAYFPPNIFAVLPQKLLPLGQTGTKFWAFTALEKNGSMGEILSVTDTGTNYEVEPIFRLPIGPTAIERLKDNSLLIEFGRKDDIENLSVQSRINSHPPLRLLPDGTVVPGCSDISHSKTQAIP